MATRSHWCVARGGCWLQDEACQVNVWRGWQTANLDAHKKPLMCGLGVAVGCNSGQKKRLVCGAGWLLAARWSLEGFRAGKRQKLLMWLDGCKIGLTLESEEGEVPHLRWSQAPPLPWPRPGSAGINMYNMIADAAADSPLRCDSVTYPLIKRKTNRRSFEAVSPWLAGKKTLPSWKKN